MILEGVLFTPDVPNKNGRIYPWDVVKKALEQARVKIDCRQMLGFLVSPGERMDPDAGLHNIALVVHGIYLHKDEVKATVELLTNVERGKMAADGVEVAKRIPTSEVNLCARGVGMLGKGNVVSEYELEGVDIEIIYKPSTPPERSRP